MDSYATRGHFGDGLKLPAPNPLALLKWTMHRAPSCPEIPEMSQMSWNCPEINNQFISINFISNQQLSWNFTRSECPDIDLNLQICCHQVASFKAKMHQIWFRLGLCPRPHWRSLQRFPRLPIDGFELSNVNWTCLYMLIKVPVFFSSYNNNFYEDRKTCIFWVLSLVKPAKMSWNFTSCSWEPWPCSVIIFSGTYSL